MHVSLPMSKVIILLHAAENCHGFILLLANYSYRLSAVGRWTYGNDEMLNDWNLSALLE